MFYPNLDPCNWCIKIGVTVQVPYSLNLACSVMSLRLGTAVLPWSLDRGHGGRKFQDSFPLAESQESKINPVPWSMPLESFCHRALEVGFLWFQMEGASHQFQLHLTISDRSPDEATLSASFWRKRRGASGADLNSLLMYTACCYPLVIKHGNETSINIH